MKRMKIIDIFIYIGNLKNSRIKIVIKTNYILLTNGEQWEQYIKMDEIQLKQVSEKSHALLEINLLVNKKHGSVHD